MDVDLGEAVESGDRRQALTAIRDKLTGELRTAQGRDAAVIAKELRATLSELDALPGGKEVSKVDELGARRKARRTDAAGR